MIDTFIAAFAGAVVALIGNWLFNRGENQRHLERMQRSESDIRSINEKFSAIELNLSHLRSISTAFSEFKESQNEINRSKFRNDKSYILDRSDKFCRQIEAYVNDIQSYLDGVIDITTLDMDRFRKPGFLRYQFFDWMNTAVGTLISDIDDKCDEIIEDLNALNLGGENKASRERIISLRSEFESLIRMSEGLKDSVHALSY